LKPENPIGNPEKGKSFKGGMIRESETEFLAESRFQKKGSPQRVSLFGGFFCF
jgi:hypothetical protein